MNPIKSTPPFIHPENVPIASQLIDEAMLSVGESLLDSYGLWTREFNELCSNIDVRGGNKRIAAELAIRRHINENRIRLEKRLERRPLPDPESGEIVAQLDSEVFVIIANDSLWPWLEAQAAEVAPKVGRDLNVAQAIRSGPQGTSGKRDSLDDYRHGPEGKLLTVRECRRFKLHGSTLTTAAKNAPDCRMKNPYGRGFIYRTDFVLALVDRRPDE